MSEPVSVWQGQFPMAGVILHCHVLDNGQRIIEADDMRRLLMVLESRGVALDEAEVVAFARWQRGMTP